MLNIRKAMLRDLEVVTYITSKTVKEIYPHYYAKGAVDFFLQHHNGERIRTDILSGNVWMLECDEVSVGTVSINGNEINRLFILPQFQGNGLGSFLMDFCEDKIFEKHSMVTLSASLPAQEMYWKRGYKEAGYHKICCRNGDFLPYTTMEKSI